MSGIEDLLTEGEELQEKTSPSIGDSKYIKGYILSVLMIIGILAVSFYPLGLGFNQMYLLTLLVVPALLLTKSEIDRHFVDYYITSEQVILRYGILNQTTESTTYSNITDVTMNKALNERIFGVGDIHVNTAGHDGEAIVLNGLKNPEKYKRMIENNVNGSANAGGGGFNDSGFDDGGGFDGDGGFDDGGFDNDGFGNDSGFDSDF